MQNDQINAGQAFDWGRTSEDYAKYRDIYPPMFYHKILDLGLCTNGQRVLDLGTGTGVLPRNLYQYGARFTGADPSANQIAQARRLSQKRGMDIAYVVASAEDADFPDDAFDVITACQCFCYFDSSRALANIARMLKSSGRFAIIYMGWLPDEDAVAYASEQLVLRYNSVWSGAGDVRRPIALPPLTADFFTVERKLVFDLRVPFTRESWHGRMKACRGIGASLPPEKIVMFDRDHRALLNRIAPEQFEVLHYTAMTVLRVKK